MASKHLILPEGERKSIQNDSYSSPSTPRLFYFFLHPFLPPLVYTCLPICINLASYESPTCCFFFFKLFTICSSQNWGNGKKKKLKKYYMNARRQHLSHHLLEASPPQTAYHLSWRACLCRRALAACRPVSAAPYSLSSVVPVKLYSGMCKYIYVCVCLSLFAKRKNALNGNIRASAASQRKTERLDWVRPSLNASFDRSVLVFSCGRGGGGGRRSCRRADACRGPSPVSARGVCVWHECRGVFRERDELFTVIPHRDSEVILNNRLTH